jgi:hypothetical protein
MSGKTIAGRPHYTVVTRGHGRCQGHSRLGREQTAHSCGWLELTQLLAQHLRWSSNFSQQLPSSSSSSFNRTVDFELHKASKHRNMQIGFLKSVY